LDLPGVIPTGKQSAGDGEGSCQAALFRNNLLALHPHPDRDLGDQPQQNKCPEAKQRGDEWAHRIIFPKSLKPGPRAAFAIVFPVLRN